MFHIVNLSLFSDLNISQGRVPTPFNSGWMFNKNFIANLLMNQSDTRILKIG